MPGPIDSEQSKGSNQLLRDGAVVIASVEDALALLGVSAPKQRPLPMLADPERRVWDVLGEGYVELDSLAFKAGLSIPECLSAITSLELMQLIDCAPSGEIRRA